MKKIKSNYSSSILVLLLLIFPSLISTFGQANFLQGYKEEVSGTRFSYHSPLPDVQLSLISRAHKEYAPIEWKTEIVPANYSEKTVSFIWLYGIDVLAESEEFEVFVNGKKYFSFRNPIETEKGSWRVSNAHGAELVFNPTMVDQHKDEMGFAVLKVPTNEIRLGESVTIKIDGAKKDNNAWYMTFKTGLKESIDVSQIKTVSKINGKLYHSARFNFIHLSEPTQAIITVNDIANKIDLKPGYNSADVNLPKVNRRTEFTAKVKVGKRKAEDYKFVLEPVKEWTVYLVQHTHTDIGYTRPQTEILPEHLRYIDSALDYCDQTDNYPDNAKFRWTCEASWSVREYLRNRPKEQIDRLLKRIKEGRIEVTGMFFNFSEIVDETALAIQTKTLKEFKARGIDVTSAMQNDVNGIGWCMIDFYKNTGVKYLTMGQHGHRAHVPFDKPTSFWWESPAGNKLLAYRSEHYMHGNALALTSGYLDVFRTNLSKYLDGLDNKKYPFDRTAFQFSGYVTDNSPPSTSACDIVKEWNEKYEWPKLKLALNSEFMLYVEQNEADYIPTRKVAWPDWWTDGFGSAMNETKAARTTQSDMIANMGLVSMAKLLGAKLPDEIQNEISECYDNLMFYDEHTFGASESISDPLAENSVIQWGEKSAYAWTAVKEASLIREKAMGIIQPYFNKSNVPTIAVFNTLNWNRSGLVTVYIDNQILPTNKKFKILDDKGIEIDAQVMTSRSDGSYWALWVLDVPAFGYKTLTINVGEDLQTITSKKSSKENFENNFYNLKIDKEKGTITSLFDKELQKELLDKNSELKLGEFVYERLDNRHAMERLTNSNRDTMYVPLKNTRTTLSNIQCTEVEEGKIWNSLKIHGDMPECSDNRGVNIEIRIYNKEKRIEFLYDMHKLPVTGPEGVYVAFPFKLEGENILSFDVQGGIINPGINQLEGTASDWNTIQNFASIKNGKEQIVFSSNDIPLAQFGDINTGHFYYKYKPSEPHIYSWVLNNYWTTNFKASQEGEMKWKYFITSSSDNSDSFASRFGWGSRVPLLTRVIPAGTKKTEIFSKSLIDVSQPNILLVNAKPTSSGDGITLHLRETEGGHAILDVNKLLSQTGASSISEVTILDDEIKVLNEPLLFEHYETKFIKIKM